MDVAHFGDEEDLLALLDAVGAHGDVVRAVAGHRPLVVDVEVRGEDRRLGVEALALDARRPAEEIVEQRRGEAAVHDADVAVEVVAEEDERVDLAAPAKLSDAGAASSDSGAHTATRLMRRSPTSVCHMNCWSRRGQLALVFWSTRGLPSFAHSDEKSVVNVALAASCVFARSRRGAEPARGVFSSAIWPVSVIRSRAGLASSESAGTAAAAATAPPARRRRWRE